jgi:hypothetical protein
VRFSRRFIKVGGINENAIADNISPRVKLYMNDETFVSGGITNESPFFVALLEDENGSIQQAVSVMILLPFWMETLVIHLC